MNTGLEVPSDSSCLLEAVYTEATKTLEKGIKRLEEPESTTVHIPFPSNPTIQYLTARLIIVSTVPYFPQTTGELREAGEALLNTLLLVKQWVPQTCGVDFRIDYRRTLSKVLSLLNICVSDWRNRPLEPEYPHLLTFFKEVFDSLINFITLHLGDSNP